MKPILINGTGTSGDRLSEAFEHAAAGMAITDLEGHFLETNPAFRHIVGRSAEDLSRQTLLSVVHPDDRRECEQNIEELASGRSSAFVREQRYMRPGGEAVWVRNSTALLHTSQTQFAQFISICEDITERRRAERLLYESEKLAIVGRLASSIAHEINNPLEAVINLLYLVRESQSLDEAQRFAAQAEQEAERVAEITKHTLRFHRGQDSADAVNVVELLQSVLVLFQGKLNQSRIHLSFEKKDAPPLVCFSGEIRQVMANLLRNAVEAMPGGGHLRLRARPATDWRSGRNGVRITIADTGQGMSREVRERIYDPFFTTKGAQGTGLGLWVTAGILAKHQGSMHVRSRDTKGASGTVFTMIFPYAGAEGKSADEAVAA